MYVSVFSHNMSFIHDFIYMGTQFAQHTNENQPLKSFAKSNNTNVGQQLLEKVSEDLDF